MMIQIKLCGMTRPEDARAAEAAGADAVGFIFAPSPRQVSAAQARLISKELGPFIARVGVFVNASRDEIEAVLEQVDLDVLQLHGSETPEQIEALRPLGLRMIKSIRVRDAESLSRLDEYPVDTFLLDSYVPGVPGGTGHTFDWSLATEIARNHRIILAGGLTPDNVAEAIKIVQPFGVDTSSGIERAPGIKDHEKMEQFIARARSSYHEYASGRLLR